MTRTICTIFSLYCFIWYSGEAAGADEYPPTNVMDNSWQTILYHGIGWPPYIILENNTETGILHEITQIFIDQYDLPIKKKLYPRKTDHAALVNGDLDLIVGISPSWYPSQTETVFSDPLLDTHDVFIHPENIPVLNYNKGQFQTLKGLEIATVRAYAYQGQDYFRRADGPNELSVLRRIAAGRYNIGIIEKNVAKYWARERKIAGFIFGSTHTSGKLRIEFNKDFSHTTLPIFNTIIAQLKTDGTIDRIIEKYIDSASHSNIPTRLN